MVIELFNSRGSTLVCQAIAQVEISDRSVGRNLLEGLVRELLEYQLHRYLNRSKTSNFASRLDQFRPMIETELGRDLQHRGVKLSGLELRPVRTEAKTDKRPGTYRWTEFLSPDIGTRDGFQVVIDTVSLVRARNPEWRIEPLYARRCVVAALTEALITSAGGLDLEDLLSRRQKWTAEAMESCQEILASAKLHLEYLAVTEIIVRPRQQTLRPPTNWSVVDALASLSLLPYREKVAEPEPDSAQKLD